MKYIILFSAIFSMNWAQAATLQDTIATLKSQPYETSVKDNNQIFSKYCIGNPETAAIPQPDYTNELVQIAAARISETKVKANEALKKMALKEMESNLKQAKSMTVTLTNSTSVKISEVGKKLSAEMDKASATGFTLQTAPLIQELLAALMADLGQSLDVLNSQLPTVLKGMDIPALVTALKALDPLLRAQLTAPDLEKIRTTSKLLVPMVEQVMVPTNYELIKAQAEIVVKEINAKQDETLGYALKQAEKLLKNFEQYMKTEDSKWNITNSASDIAHFISAYVTETNGEITETLRKAMETLNAEVANANYESNIASGKLLLKLLEIRKPQF